jgi:drug/metabolite transporter (DMT)-like permease
VDSNNGDKKTVPLIQFVSSMLIFGTIGIFRRYISLPSGFLIFARGLLGGLSVILFVKLRSGHVFRRSGMRHLVWLILTGVLLGSEWIMLFEAYNLTTVAIASLCNYMQPIIVLLLSPLVFKERMTAKKLICGVIAVAGMVLVSGVTEGNVIAVNHTKGVLLGLGSAILYAMFVIMNKKITNIDPYTKTMIAIMIRIGMMCGENQRSISPTVRYETSIVTQWTADDRRRLQLSISKKQIPPNATAPNRAPRTV